MHLYICVLIMANVFSFISSETEVNEFDVFKSVKVHHRIQGEETTSPPTSGDERKRRKRSIYDLGTVDVSGTVNSLRRSVGASNMNYLPHDILDAYGAYNWTGYCNFDEKYYRGYAFTDAYVVYGVQNGSRAVDLVSQLKQIYNTSNFYYPVRSVYLISVGAGVSYCTRARFNGRIYADVYLTAYVFSVTSNFVEYMQQYALGRQCTACLSGSYWCYNGLCKDDCSTSDASCYCDNSNCLNSASVNKASCRCQCSSGWTGSHCESAAPVPKPNTGGVKNGSPIGKSKIQLMTLCAAMALLFRF